MPIIQNFDTCSTFRCDDLQIIAIHDYNLDPSYVASGIDAAKPSALSSGKRLLYEEFGAEGSSKQSQIETVTNTLISVSFDVLLYWAWLIPLVSRREYRGCIGR